MKTVLGGISMPRVPAAATVPVARVSSYLYFFISGSAIRPMVAAVAAVEPHMAANPAQASTVAMVSPPRRCPTQL